MEHKRIAVFSILDMFLVVAILTAAAVAAVIAFSRGGRAVPPCYDMAGGSRLCIYAAPLPEADFFRPPRDRGPIVTCDTNTAGLLVCGR